MQEDFDVRIVKKNATFCKVLCEQSILHELADAFTYDFPGAKFTPKFKAGIWDGKIRCLSAVTRQIYVGLIPQIIQYCKENNLTVSDEVSEKGNIVTREIIEKFCKSLNIQKNGKPIDIYDYQVDAVYQAIKNKRLTTISPTSSGKSLIIYCIIRWLLLNEQKGLLLVPTVNLVAQMRADFIDYSTANGWDADNFVHMVTAGKPKQSEKLVILSTWQSLYKIGRGTKKGGQVADGLTNAYFEQFDWVMCDEVHLGKAASITGIMERCINAYTRFGFTGTLSDIDIDELVIMGHFGQKFTSTTTAEMTERGQATKMKIRILNLKYPQEIRKMSKKMSYDEQLDYVVTSQRRNEFVAKLAISQKENVIVFFNFEKQGKPLADMLEQMADGKKKILYIDGGVDVSKREDIRQLIAKRNDLILVASYGTLSTGWNSPNLHVAIFASPSKGKIRVLQSLGRMLRLNDGKDEAILFDLCDDLSANKKTNYLYEWAIGRIKYYCQEKHEYKILDIPSHLFS